VNSSGTPTSVHRAHQTGLINLSSPTISRGAEERIASLGTLAAVPELPFEVPPFDPEVAPYAGDERAVVSWLLDYHRHVLVRKVEGITDEEARMTIAPSDLTLLGLVRHLAYVEQYWFAEVFLGLNETAHWDDPDDRDRDFHPLPDDSLADALRLLHAEIDRARRIATTTSFDACAVGQREGQPVSLRWIMVHLVEEYARHCGHADFLRQAIDSATDH
jgi:hypothetical protein